MGVSDLTDEERGWVLQARASRHQEGLKRAADASAEARAAEVVQAAQAVSATDGSGSSQAAMQEQGAARVLQQAKDEAEQGQLLAQAQE